MRRRMVHEKRGGFLILVIALAVVLLVTACGPTPTTPTEEKAVQVGVLFPLTGGGGPATQPAFQGLVDYVTYFNEEKPIPGHPIELRWRDTMTQRAPAISGYAWFVDRHLPLIWFASPQDLSAVSNRLERDQVPIPMIACESPEMIEPPGWVFSTWSPWSESISVLLDYFMENWKEERPPKLTFFVIDVGFGWEPSKDAAEYAETVGFEVLPFEVGSHVIVDATTQLLRIQESGADLVYIQHIFTGIAPILRDAHRLELTGEMQFATWMFAESVRDMAPMGSEGLMFQSNVPWFDETDIPGVITFLDQELEFHGEVVEDGAIMQGWVYGALTCEAVKLALEEVGYENLDGPAMRSALESMDFDLDGIARITFGPEDRRGVTKVAIYQVQDSNPVRMTDWKEAPSLV